MPAFFDREASSQSFVSRAAVVLALWTAFGLFSSAHFFFGKPAGGTSELIDLASHVFPFYWGWALLTPLVLAVARDARSRADRSPGWLAWWRIGALAPLVVVLHAASYFIPLRLFGIEPAQRFDVPALLDFIRRHGVGDMATYLLLVGVYLLFDARERARERARVTAELEARLARADLELLRWQLQPHFLFNTLNALSTLVLKGELQATDRAIGLIARYLRTALAQRSDAMVTLADELAVVEEYLAIERLRFGDQIRLDLHADDASLATRLPSLVIQPLVENAIRHGVARNGGTLEIEATVRTGRLRLTVRDRRAPAAVATLATPVNATGNGFGLRYVRGRLNHFYDDAHLDLVTAADGTDVTLDLPLSPRPTMSAA